jgi:hypothetical protein
MSILGTVLSAAGRVKAYAENKRWQRRWDLY